MKKKSKRDLQQEVTDRIISLLEKGVCPWKKTFGTTYGYPKNYATGRHYNGINFFIMNFLNSQIYEVPYYLSFKQCKALGGSIKKGSKASYVYFYSSVFKDKDGKNYRGDDASIRTDLNEIRFLKCYPVFNISCVEGIELDIPQPKEYQNEPLVRFEEFLSEIKPNPVFVQEMVSQAYYDKIKDVVNVPEINSFVTSEAHASVMSHELIHWSGGAKRLNRDGVSGEHKFGSKEYATEELVAELGSAMIMSHLNIQTDVVETNSAAYLQNWITSLKADKNILFRAAPKAFEAVNYLLNGNLIDQGS